MRAGVGTNPVIANNSIYFVRKACALFKVGKQRQVFLLACYD